MAEENWDDKLEYLQRGRFLYHNDDYLEFLVRKVWHLNEPCKIADFGCGYGYIGTKFMPLLPSGSAYTGIDTAPTLLAAATQIFSKTPYTHRFIESEVYTVPCADNSFDVCISHAVLMHLKRPFDALKEMIRVTRNGGLIITCDANRNSWSSLFYVDELNTQEVVPLGLTQQLNKDIREKTGIDYNIGVKTPVLMEKAGLKNIGCRLSDSLVCLFPSMEGQKRKRIFEALCNEGLGSPKEPGWQNAMLSHGVSFKDIETQRAMLLKEDFSNKGQSYHTVWPGLMTWSYGRVVKGD